jgi:diadenylate cyclase
MIDAMPPLTWVAAVDILLVAVLIYQTLMIIRGRRAAHIMLGLAVVGGLYLVSVQAGLVVMRTLLETLVPYSAFALIVMFQSEIRRMLARIGERPWINFGSRFENREVADEILLAIDQLMQHRTGALIVVERDIGLRTFIESGVPVEARVTRDLLLSIFQPGAALHDGAVIVQGGRVAAAACFLPLTMNPELSRKLGTRHRAGIGVTEESDCLAIIVSEERGTVSLASHGELEMDVPIETVAQRLGGTAPRRRTPSTVEAAREALRR